ncbi:MAG: UvrB/UvrC motif-containing protein [Gaiellaceae bacterium]
MERLRAEKEAAIEAKDFERAAALRDRERQLRFGTGEHSRELRPPRWTSFGPRIERTTFPLVIGWALFGVALGVGLLLGWLIWG